MKLHEFNAGDKVTYGHLHRGGYGYTTYHPAVVLKVNSKSVTIIVARLNHESRLYGPALATVKGKNLKPRQGNSDFEYLLKAELLGEEANAL